jgi:hypothetical protein
MGRKVFLGLTGIAPLTPLPWPRLSFVGRVLYNSREAI